MPPITLERNRRQLFLHEQFDEHLVESLDGVTRTLHQPSKRGAVLKAEHPWEGVYISTFSPPMWVHDEGIYKQVYECRHTDRGTDHSYALATSTDGITWDKPHLGLVDFDGSRDNNLFLTPDGRRLVHVVYDIDDPDPSRRYKGLVTTRRGRVPTISEDGLHWTKLDVELPSHDAGSMAFDRERRLFLAMLKTNYEHTVGRSYHVSTSSDFETWSQPRYIFGMDKDRDQQMALDVIRARLGDVSQANPLFVDPDPAIGWQHPKGSNITPTWRAECYNFGVVPYEGIYLGVITAYYPTGQRLPEETNADGFNVIQLAASRDLETWYRLGDRQAFIETSPITDGLVGNYDRQQLGAYNGIVLRDDEVRVYYTGMKCRVPQHDRWMDGSPRDPDTLSPAQRADWLEDTHSAMCLATLRRDGFVSLDADASGGMVTTRPLTLAGSGLCVNANASGGSVHVDVLDEAGNPIEGRAGESAAVVKGDATRAELRWPQHDEIGDLRGRAVRLRFRLNRASLYSFWNE